MSPPNPVTLAFRFAATHIKQLCYEQLYRSNMGRLPPDAKTLELREILAAGGVPAITVADAMVRNLAMAAVVNHPERPDSHIFVEREDGLAHCMVCGGAEASLPIDCPNEKMSDEKAEGVQHGTLNYIDGEWFKGRTVNYHFIPTEPLE